MSAAELQEQGWDEAQAQALVGLYDAIEAFKVAFGAVAAAGVKPAEALEACGYTVPLFARPMVNTLLMAD